MDRARNSLMKYQIKLNSIEEVIGFAQRLDRYECKADAVCDNVFVNAKSIIGLICLGIGRTFQLLIHNEFDENLENDLKAFIII